MEHLPRLIAPIPVCLSQIEPLAPPPADPDAEEALFYAIARDGLREPVEVCRSGGRFLLLSGHRRLAAWRRLEALRPDGGFGRIPAFLRDPSEVPQTLCTLVARREAKGDLAPWARAVLVEATLRHALFPDAQTAIEGLWPGLAPPAQHRLRAVLRVLQAFGPGLAAPETWPLRSVLRLAMALERDPLPPRLAGAPRPGVASAPCQASAETA